MSRSRGQTADGTANAASDYTAVTTGSATVTAGQTSATISGRHHGRQPGRGRRDVHGDALRALGPAPAGGGEPVGHRRLRHRHHYQRRPRPDEGWCSPWPRRRWPRMPPDATDRDGDRDAGGRGRPHRPPPRSPSRSAAALPPPTPISPPWIGLPPDHRGQRPPPAPRPSISPPPTTTVAEGSETVTGVGHRARSERPHRGRHRALTLTDDDTATVSVAAASAVRGRCGGVHGEPVGGGGVRRDGGLGDRGRHRECGERLHRGHRGQRNRQPPARPAPLSRSTTTEDVLVEAAETFTVTLSRAPGHPAARRSQPVGDGGFGYRHHHRRRPRADEGWCSPWPRRRWPRMRRRWPRMPPGRPP